MNSEVVDVKGSIGDFKIKVKSKAEAKNTDLNVGVIITATGAYEYKPDGWYQYGKNENVMTQLELSEKLRNNELKDLKKSLIEEALSVKKKIKILKVKPAGDIAPYKYRYRIEIKVLP